MKQTFALVQHWGVHYLCKQAQVVLVVTLMCVTTCVSAGCSTSNAESHSEEIQSIHFSGPYAHDFKAAYHERPSPYFREVIRDGVVTAAELAMPNHGHQTVLRSRGHRGAVLS